MSRLVFVVGLFVFAAGSLTLLLREPLLAALAGTVLVLVSMTVLGLLLLHGLVRGRPRA